MRAKRWNVTLNERLAWFVRLEVMPQKGSLQPGDGYVKHKLFRIRKAQQPDVHRFVSGVERRENKTLLHAARWNWAKPKGAFLEIRVHLSIREPSGNQFHRKQ